MKRLSVNVIGRLGADASVKEVNGKKVANFNVAVNESYKDKEGKKQSTTVWVDAALWNAEPIYPFLKKGTLVAITGKPGINAYIKDDKAEGGLKVTVDNITLLGDASSKDLEMPGA